MANEIHLGWGHTKTNILNNDNDGEHIVKPHKMVDDTNPNNNFDREQPETPHETHPQP